MSFRKDERHEALYQLPADLEATPETFSHLFLPDIYVETVAKHSTAYAKMRNGLSARPILPADILHFFAIFYLMGVVRLPCEEDYWKTNGSVNISMLNEYGMASTKFQYIWRHIHFRNARACTRAPNYVTTYKRTPKLG